MNSDKSEKETLKFCDKAIEYWAFINIGDSKSANKASKATNTIVGKWSNGGTAVANLTNLIKSSDKKVKFAAAAHLINFDKNKSAIAVLTDLVKDDQTLISSTAFIILQGHNINIDLNG